MGPIIKKLVQLAVPFVAPLAQEAYDRILENLDQKKQVQIRLATEELESATGAKAVIAYEKLLTLLDTEKNPNGAAQLKDLLTLVNFDPASIKSKHLGTIKNLDGRLLGNGASASRQIRIYKDWVIAGDKGYDFDASTRGDVWVDDSATVDKKNIRVKKRVATMQLETNDWSHTFRIDPDEANMARRILDQLVANTKEVKPKG